MPSPEQEPWKFVAVGNVARGFIAFGNVAVGFIAFGNVAYGVISVGISISTGIVAFGLNAVGLVGAVGLNAVAPFALGGINAIGALAVAGVNAIGAVASGGVNSEHVPLAALVVGALLLAGSFALPRIGPDPVDVAWPPAGLASLADVLGGRTSRAWVAATLRGLDASGLRVRVDGAERALEVRDDAAHGALRLLGDGRSCAVWLDVEAFEDVRAPAEGAGYREAAPVVRAARVVGVEPQPPGWRRVLVAADPALRWSARAGAVACLVAWLLAR